MLDWNRSVRRQVNAIGSPQQLQPLLALLSERVSFSACGGTGVSMLVSVALFGIFYPSSSVFTAFMLLSGARAVSLHSWPMADAARGRDRLPGLPVYTKNVCARAWAAFGATLIFDPARLMNFRPVGSTCPMLHLVHVIVAIVGSPTVLGLRRLSACLIYKSSLGPAYFTRAGTYFTVLHRFANWRWESRCGGWRTAACACFEVRK
jgi:hypothetical protein